MQSLSSLFPDGTAAFFSSTTGLGIVAAAGLFYVFVWCRIFAKAGYPLAWGFLTLFPPMLLVVPLILAFGPWPVLKEQRELRRVHKAVHKADHRYQKVA